MLKRILILVSVLPAVLKNALFFMHAKNSAGNIAVGAIIQTNALLIVFSKFSSVSRETFIGN
jgi:hypothetical protein